MGLAEDCIQRAQCIGCKKIFKSGDKTHGTSTLRRYMKSCQLLKIHFHDIGQMIFDVDGKIRSKKLDIELAREVFASAIVEHDCPFAFAEYSGFRKYHKLLNPDASVLSRNTMVSDINKLYVKEKYKLRQVMTSIPNRICLTSDLCTSCTTEGYLCLIGHFVDEKWKLKSKILAFEKMPPPHTGFELTQKIYEILKDWGIEKKVFSLTLDNASNNDSMQDKLKDQLTMHDSLLCEGEFFHIRCSTHILNLIVQEGLKVANQSMHKIRESVKYVKSTESRMQNFKSVWLKLLALIPQLAYVWKIERLLKAGLSDEDTLMSGMCKKMLEKFDKYWSEYSVVLAFGDILDPRFKLKVLEKLYAKIETDPTKCKEKIELLKTKLHKLYDQYASVIGSSSSQLRSSNVTHSKVESQKVVTTLGKKMDILDVTDEVVTPVEISELDRYPILSRMARDLLAIPITIVASESAFSIGARVLTKYRSSLLPEKMQTLICTRNWLHGFEPDCDDVDKVEQVNEGDEGDGADEGDEVDE
ncbi:PREDICTED: zinc finger BED domain-containing protein RICESLEEPER 2-like [Ipomoea nil]|uniref:zinc finger BED domain-containing protein RICESLEEPER 2-like n=1 Tax=Ipomoea nil TaxID=35883 RepID=UPI0009008FD7|nr:PREDICTED: zinc finger BED domain-containing protein RICESLEEPER 2-like [Ipomoea nil]